MDYLLASDEWRRVWCVQFFWMQRYLENRSRFNHSKVVRWTRLESRAWRIMKAQVRPKGE